VDEPEKPNWRKGYQETILATQKELRWCREHNVERRIEYHWKTYRAGDLTDAQIDKIARFWAERDINRAIQQHNSKI
jgi:hypothetical protein